MKSLIQKAQIAIIILIIITISINVYGFELHMNNKSNMLTANEQTPIAQSSDSNNYLANEEDEDLIEVYNEIELISDIEIHLKARIEQYIEYKIFNQLNSILATDSATTSKIEISVDETGKVSNIEVYGQNVSNNLKQNIKNTISDWDFKTFRLKYNWKFKIVL